MIIQQHIEDIHTPSGLMRTTVYRPQQAGQFNAIIFYSEIFQQTGPIARSASGNCLSRFEIGYLLV